MTCQLIKRTKFSFVSTMLACVGIVASGSAYAQQTTGGNVKLPMQGVLTTADGQPMQASVTMTFSLYANVGASSALWTESQTVQVGDVFPGVYNVYLGAVAPITADVFQNNPDVHIGVRIGTGQEIGRWPVGHTPKSAFSPLSGSAGSGGGGGGPNQMLDDAYVNITGDTMTGALSLPANGLSCGSNQLVLANGFVGMGTRNPERTLHVVGPDGEVTNAVSAFTDATLVVENNDNAIVEVISNSNSGAGTGRLVLRGANASNYGSVSYDSANRRMELGADTSANPAMTIANNGNVGIGTNTPGNNAGYTTVAINNAVNGGMLDFQVAGSRVGTIYTNGANDFRVGTVTNSALQFITNSNANMTITGNGNVGIGNINPTVKLAVNGRASADALALASANPLSWGNGSALITGDTAANYMAFATAGNERLRIDANGNVGIGTSTPRRPLDVMGRVIVGQSADGDSEAYGVRVLRGGSPTVPGAYRSTTALLRAGDYAGDGPTTVPPRGLIQVETPNISTSDANAQNATLFTANQGNNFGVSIDGRSNVYVGQTSWARNATSDRSLFVQNSVGIGTSAPGFDLDINKSRATANVQSSQGDARLMVRADGGTAYMRLEDVGSKSYDLRVVDGSNDFEVFDVTAAASRLIVKGNGNVGIGTNSPNSTLDVSGTVNGRQGLCINGDCRSDWASVVTSGAAWLSTSGVTRLRSATDSVVIGGTTANITGRSFEVQGTPTRLDGRNTAGLRLDLAGTGDFLLRETSTTDLVQMGTMYQNVSSGLVGIGTSTPNGYGNVKLDVAGAYGINNQGIINLSSGGDLAFGDLASGDGNINNIYFRTRDATKMTLTANGRLGIGTTSPAGALDVNGSICISGDCRSSWPGGGGVHWNRSGTNTILANGNDNVGIGTSSPVAKLDVNGDVRLFQGNAGQSSKLFFGGETDVNAKAMYMENYWIVLQPHGNEGFRIRDTSPSGQQQILAQFNGLSGNNNGDIHLAPVWGNIGIGTNTPATKLDVRGDTRLWAGSPGNSPKLYFGNETDAAAKAMYMENYWMVIQPHGNEGLMIRDTNAQGNKRVLAQFNGIGGSNNGNIALAPTGGVVGIGTNTPNGYANVKLDVAGAYGINNQAILSLSGSGDLQIGDLASGDGNISNLYFRTLDRNRMILTSNGRLGVGTFSPAGTLDVNGSICINGDCKNSWNDVNGGRPWIRSGTNTVLANNGDRVGVGTATPDGDFEVRKQNTGTGTRLMVTNSDNGNTATQYSALTLRGLTNNNTEGNQYVTMGEIRGIRERAWTSRANADSGLGFFTTLNAGSNERMRLTSAGNLGVGTNSPGARLDVLQTAANDDDVGLLLRAGTASERPRLRFGGVANNWEVSANNDWFSLRQVDGTGAGEHLVIENGGNIGIGTTNPTYKLHVVGDDPNHQIRVTRNGTGNANLGVDTTGAFVEAQSNIPLRFYAGGGERMYINPNGNIGVGSRTTYARFSVDGGISSGNMSSGVGDLRLFDTGNNSWRTRGVGSNSFLTDMEGTGAVGNWEVRDMNMNVRGGRIGIGYSGAPQGTLQVWNTNQYNTAEGSNGQDSLILYGSAGNADGQYFGGITWSNGGRRRAGIASVMEHTDSDHVGLAFFTRGTDGPGPMYETMRLTRNGQLLLGTTTPWGKMHVSGGSMKLSNPGSHSVLYWVDSNNGSADMGMDSGTLRIRTTGGNHPIVFHPGDQGERMRLLQNGNVGIGTAAPVERLHVNGKVRGNELCIGGDCRNSWPSSGGATFWSQNGNNIYPRTIANNVGIGTNTPGAKLEIAESAYRTRFTGSRIEFNRAGGDSYIDKTDANRLRFRMGSGYADAMTITGDRRIGIRTTSPSEALQVNGRARSTNLTVDNQAYIGGRAGIGWTSNWHQNLSIRKGLALQSDRSTGAYLQMYLDGNDDIRWDVYGSAWVNRLFMDKDNGRLGLGTAAPMGQLHVNGVDARSNAVTIAGSVPGLYFHDTETASGAFRYSSFMMEADGNRFYIGSRGRTTSGTMGSGSRRFTIDDNGKVGIMTSNPAEELDVRGAIRVGQNAAGDNNYYGVEVFRNGTSAAPGAYRSLKPAFYAKDLAADGPSTYQFRGLIHAELPRVRSTDTNAANAALFSIYNDNGHTVRIDGKANLQVGYWQQTVAGNRNLVVENSIGVGTRSPARKLHVDAGGWQNDSTFINGRVGIGWNSNWHRTLSIREGLSLQGTDSHTAYLQQYLDSSQNLRFDLYGSAGWVNRMFINNDNGRIGVGTTSPNGTLDVRGSLCIDGVCRGSWADVHANDGFWQRSGTNTSLRNTGDLVGIGTTAPSEKLSVNGNMEILNSNSIILRTNNTGGSRRGFIRATEGSPHLDIATSSGEDIAFRDGGPDGTINLFIGGPYGNVGIGVADRNDNFKFRVLGSGRAGGHAALFDGGQSNTYVGVAAGNRSHYVTQRTNGQFAIHRPSVGDRLMIADNGRVGIGNGFGANTPAATLQVFEKQSNGDSYNAISIGSSPNSGRGGSSELNFVGHGSGDGAYIDYSRNSGRKLRFRSVETDALGNESGHTHVATFASNGNVGIGTDGPAEKLHINGNLRGPISGAIRVNTGNGYLDLGPMNSSWAHIQTDRGRFYFNRPVTVDSGDIKSYNERLELNAHNQDNQVFLNTDGNVGIATGSPGAKLQVGNQGSHFFHIGGYDKTYADAVAQCTARGARLATYAEMVDRFKGGSNGPCSWGWTDHNGSGVITYVMQNGASGGCGGSTGGVRWSSQGLSARFGANCARDIVRVKGTLNASSSIHTKKIQMTGAQSTDRAYFGLISKGYVSDYMGINITQASGRYLRFDSSGNLNANGDINGGRLCIGGNCKSSWPSGGGSTYWTRSGSRLYIRNSGDSVGIGISSPSQKLSVNGNISLHGADRRIQDENGDWSVGGTGENLEFREPEDGNRRWGYIQDDWGMVMDTAPNGYFPGRVGVGSRKHSGSGDTARGRLHVTAGTNRDWTWSSIGSQTSLELGDRTDNTVGSIRLNSYDANHFVYIRPSNGNYHIDSTRGYYYFNWDESVRGSSNGVINVANEAGSHRIQLHTAGNSFLNGGNIGFGTTGPSTKVDVQGHLYVGDERFANPGSWDRTINIDSNVHARLLVEERASGVQNVLWSHTGGNAAVGTISGHDLRIMASGEKIRVKTNGRVGIGTTSPSQMLDVVGNIEVSGADRRIQDENGDWSVGGTGENLEFREPEDGNRRWGYIQDDWGMVMDTAPNGYFPGRVGVGSRKHSGSGDTARGRLHVTQGTSRDWTWSGIGAQTSLELGDRSDNTVGSIRLNSYDANHFVYIRPSNGNYHIDSTRGYYYFNWDESVRGSSNGVINVANEAGSHRIQLHTAGNSFLNGGNIGFGTTGPSTKVDVQGHLYVGDERFANPGSWDRTINIDSNVHARLLVEERASGVQNVLWSHTGGNAAVGTISGHDLRIMASGEKIRVKTNGRVGIGTTSPSQMLEVVGNIEMAGADRRIQDEHGDWSVGGTGENLEFREPEDGNKLWGYIQDDWGLRMTSRAPHVEAAGRLYAGDAVCIRGSCRSSWPSGGSSGYQFIRASAGGGDNGIGWPNDPYGGGGDDAWIRYYRDGGGEDTALQIGISNDDHDEMELYSGRAIELYGPGGTHLGFNFPNDRWGGGGDDAWIHYYGAGGEATRLQIGIMNDDHDHIEFYSNSVMLIEGPRGGASIGFDFQNDRWGGGGDDAWMRLERHCGGECYRLAIGVRNDGHDYIDISSSGGTYFNGRRRYDIAEQVAVSESVEAGDILTIDENNVEMFRIARSSDTRFIAGVVAYEPAIVLGDKKDGTPPVTLAGNTPVKVTLENGPINPGDTLVLSTTPGHAMKGGSCDNCAVIGVALESFSGDSEHGDRGYVRTWISPTTSQGAANTKSPTQDSAAVYEKRIEDLEARIDKLESLLENSVK